MPLILAMSDLPPTSTTRWTNLRKGTVLQAIEQGLISADDARKRYRLSIEELAEWQTSFARGGFGALLVTKREPRHV